MLPRPSGPTLQWRKEGTRWVMPDLQSEFLDWLLTLPEDREHKTATLWAEAHGVRPQTVRDWKKNDKFLAEWTRRAHQKNISVDRVQNVLDALYRAAVADKPDVNAAQRWLGYIEKLMPPQRAERDPDISDLSDEDLLREIAELQMEEGVSEAGSEDYPGKAGLVR